MNTQERKPHLKTLGLFVLALLLFPIPGLLSQEFSPQWRGLDLGSKIGLNGLFAEDVNQDGQIEIIAGDGAYFSLISYQAGSYYVSWTSKLYNAEDYKPNVDPISKLTLAKDPISGAVKIYLLLSDGRMDVYDGLSLRLEQTHDFMYSSNSNSAPEFSGFEIADLSQDSQAEIVILTDNGVDIYDQSSFQLQRSIASGDGLEMDILNIDGDPALEIIVTHSPSFQDYSGYILDGSTYQTQLTTSNGFGSTFTSGDINQDGLVEIIALYPEVDSVKAFDPRTGTELWGKVEGRANDVIELIQLPGDSIPFLYLPDGNFMIKRHPQSYAEVSFFRIGANTGDGSSSILLEDMDQDGEEELILATGLGSTASDHLFVINPRTEALEWNSINSAGSFYINFGDVDGDGQKELVSNPFIGECACFDRASTTEISIYDPISYELKRKVWAKIQGTFNKDKTYGTLLVNADTDPALEIVIGTGAAIRVYDYQTDTLIAERLGDFASWNRGMAVGDLEGDGLEEIITLDDQGELRVLNPLDLSDKWSFSINPAASHYQVLIGQMDVDPAQEIIILSRNGILVYDGISQVLEWQSSNSFFTSIYGNLVDFNQDGNLDIIAADVSGNIITVSSQPYVETLYDQDSTRIGIGNFSTKIYATDLGQGPETEIIVQDDSLRVYSFPDFKKIYQREKSFIAASFDPNSSMIINDIDNDGNMDLWLSDFRGIFHFKNGPLAATSIDDDLGSGSSLRNVRVFPNPFSDRFEIEIELKQASPLILKLYKLNGQLVWRQEEGLLAPGSHTINSSPLSLSPGFYYLQFSGRDFRFAKKLVIN